MNQTWEKDKKPNFVPDFGLLGPNFGPQFFFCFFAGFTSTSSYTLFQAIALYSLMKTNEPNLKKGKKN